MTHKQNVIEVQNLGKTYPQDLTFKSIIAHLMKHTDGTPVFSEISFLIPRGQVVGLIGSNGAGKSTLLRIIAGHAKQSTGRIHTEGRILAILQISTGLRDDWTGRENIHSLGVLYGMSDAEIAARSEDIISFAQLEKAIDNEVRTYSSGMRARLAFSLVTSADFDILLIDEALSVGDAGFAQRCRERIRSLCSRGLTVIIVSHSTTAIRELCDRVLWLDGGRIVADGLPEIVVEDYRLSMLVRAEEELSLRYAHRTYTNALSSMISIDDLWFASDRGRVVVVSVGSHFSVQATLKCREELTGIRGKLEFLRVDGVLIMSNELPPQGLSEGVNILSANFGPMRLGRFAYECRLTLLNSVGELLAERTTVIAVEDHTHSFNSSYYQPIEWQQDFYPMNETKGDFLQ